VPRVRHSESGPMAAGVARFTLLEVIIAVTLLLLVVTGMLGFGREITRSWEKLRAEHGRFRDLLVLDRALDGLLSNAVPFTWPDSEGESRQFFFGESDYVRLACLRPVTRVEDGALRFAEILLDDGRLMVVSTAHPWRDPSDADERSRTTVLATGVERLEFSYADWAGDDEADWDAGLIWVDEWDPERTEMPLAILLTVQWRDGRVESWLRRTAAGYRERWGKWQPARDNP